MASRKDAEAASETLREIESVFDHAAQWVGSHPLAVMTSLGLILAVAAGVGGTRWMVERREVDASEAVAKVEIDYLAAMGATPGQIEAPEPANPETARQARLDAIARYREVAQAQSGRVAAVQAWLAAGNLEQAMGDLEAALASWQRAVDEAEPASKVRALALSRLGRGFESAGRWGDAARVHEEASAIEEYPLRFYALADAARCAAEAGERERAVALFDRVESEAPGLALPEHVRTRLRELQLAGR